MNLDPDLCHAALAARDARFDGLFFVGVSTTGIYCRPICPARTPGPDRCAFFAMAAEAERAGFRACFRCRPELAPGHGAVDALSRLVRAAVQRIDAGFLNEGSVDELAAGLGVSARHLRRAMDAELGVSPVALAQTRRLALAKQLLQDTRMPVTDVAHAAGFQSVRRFDAAFQERFGRSPSALRRAHGADGTAAITLRLDCRPPLDLAALLRFLAGRAIPGVEVVDEQGYRRTVRLGERTGWIGVRGHPTRAAVEVSVSPSLAPRLMHIAARVRALFDLDARPDVIAAQLGADPTLARSVAAHPGLRVPGSFEPFETMVRAILGQQVSVRGATTLSGRLVERFGEPVETDIVGLTRIFPGPERLASASEEEVRSVGLPAARARSLRALAAAVASGAIDLSDTTDPQATIAALQQLPGIGPWTAQYAAMRVLHWPDAFPAGDLVIRKALGLEALAAVEARAEPWRPWRAYGAMHLWNSQ